MASRRREPDFPQIKHLTLQEIQAGILKLGRRLQDVQGLRDERVRYRDQRISDVTHAIRDTILEIWGPTSPEFHTHRYHEIYDGVHYVGMPEEESQAYFEAGISKSITMLEGLINRLVEKEADIAVDTPSRVRAAFNGLDLHPKIATACTRLYRDGHYRNAVQDAATALIKLVKDKSGRQDLDGSPLMSQVFSTNKPILAFNDGKDLTEQSEQQGMMHLFMGAVLALRNPRSHSLMTDSPEQALEYIAFLSLLAKEVDKAKRVG